jgi:branched-chain amino acid transport system permease protein
MTHEVAEVLISGIALGAVYAIMSVGMTLVYGVSRVFNFAYGSFYIWGAYLAWVLFGASSEMTYPAVFAIVISVMFLFGLGVERGVVAPLRRKADWQMLTVMSTLGLAIFLDNAALIAFGPRKKALPPLLEGSINVGGFTVSTHEMATLAIAVLVMVIIGLFLGRTRLGKTMRAVAQDGVGARMVGIKVNRVFGYAFALSTALAAISGILLAPKYFMYPLGGWTILIKAWIVVAFGGLGSVKGTILSAFILGIVEAFVGWYFGLQWVLVFWFALMLGILAVRPRGLLGTGE